MTTQRVNSIKKLLARILARSFFRLQKTNRNFIKDACNGLDVGEVTDRGSYQIIRNGDKVAIRVKKANEEFRVSIDGECCSGFAYIEQDDDLDLFCDISVDCWGDNGEESVDTYTTIYNPTNMYDVAIELAQEIEAEYGGELGIDLDALEAELSDQINMRAANTTKKGNRMYRWYRYAQEEPTDPVEREFEALMKRLRDAQGQDTLVEELQDVCSDPKDYALLCAGFGDGE
ncbi:MAG: hypothetical protein II445_11445, partial [Muribaculaceae bacterium]|nr:hypothetical protein [Muribaculaceae bacterium]